MVNCSTLYSSKLGLYDKVRHSVYRKATAVWKIAARCAQKGWGCTTKCSTVCTERLGLYDKVQHSVHRKVGLYDKVQHPV